MFHRAAPRPRVRHRGHRATPHGAALRPHATMEREHWERGREGGAEGKREGALGEREGGVRERDRREGGVPGNVLVPVRVFVHLIYSTLSIGPGNGIVLGQNFGGVPYKITASENGFMEAAVLRRPPP